jgi:hypothetical protein
MKFTRTDASECGLDGLAVDAFTGAELCRVERGADHHRY